MFNFSPSRPTSLFLVIVDACRFQCPCSAGHICRSLRQNLARIRILTILRYMKRYEKIWNDGRYWVVSDSISRWFVSWNIFVFICVLSTVWIRMGKLWDRPGAAASRQNGELALCKGLPVETLEVHTLPASRGISLNHFKPHETSKYLIILWILQSFKYFNSSYYL